MKTPFITLSITILMAMLFTVFGSAPEQLTWFTRDDWQQPWRLLTAHFVHSDIQHLIWNAGAFLLLGSIIEQFSRRDLLLSIFVGIISVNIFLISLYELNAYVGFSGVLNSILIVTLFKLSTKDEYQDVVHWTLMLSMLKIIIELYSKESLFSSITWATIPEAHLCGWLAGVVLILVQVVSRQKEQAMQIVIPSQKETIKKAV